METSRNWIWPAAGMSLEKVFSRICRQGAIQHLSFIFLLSYYCCTGGTLWHLQKLLQYIIVEFTPSITPWSLPSPIPGIVSTCLIFPFSYMNT
jgi:hypothetical protein